jgi:hypothetical protein
VFSTGGHGKDALPHREKRVGARRMPTLLRGSFRDDSTDVGSGSIASWSALAGRWPTSAMPRKRTQVRSIGICRDGPEADVRLNAIWHAFVLLATICHYTAVLEFAALAWE